MKTLQLIQGSKEWHLHRAQSRNASDASAMLGLSKKKTRTELLDQKTTGIVPEVDEATQFIFDKGHLSESTARPKVEGLLGAELYPVTVTDGYLSASLDGITLDEAVIWENKLFNKVVADFIEQNNDLPDTHWPQVEQQLIITQAQFCLFTLCSDDAEFLVSFEYRSIEARRQAVLNGWKQFDEDLKNHSVETVIEKPVANPVMELPALTFKLNGLALSSNLDVYKEAAKSLVEKSKQKIETDQDFADCELMNKKFKEAEEKLKQIQANVIGEVADIDQFTKELEHIGELFRQARLNGEKQVKNRKEEIRNEIIEQCKKELADHVQQVNESFAGHPFRISLPPVAADFGGAMKGKKTIASLKDSARAHLADVKIESNQTAYLIKKNILEIPEDFKFLFADLQAIVLKESDDFRNLVQMRIQQHEQEQEQKKKAALAQVEFQRSLSQTILVAPVDEKLPEPEQTVQQTIQAPAINKALTVSQNDILAMREFRTTLQNLIVPTCESSKGDIMATKVKQKILEAIQEINWQIN